ncbi:TadE-like protein [Sphingomonas sp. YR710]|uniref:TadE/TadG family type IV pilus assembly protein n=1 Tax=Sphingomonas sp. YR710 TaxID=1882773 RepID=UPI00088E0880|nr:TadE/TadG family type IV pilus assembly protein [Sphingomonas sp. YR710]SDD48986.1 TadE-like protein [Sphingomonas sp. YR710]
MTTLLHRLLRAQSGGTAVEFALVLPLLMIFTFGIIDVGRFMWTWNRAEKATQMGVRFAVATKMIPQGLYDYSFASSGGIPQGDPVPTSAFGGATCKSTGGTVSCTCNAGATCPSLGTANSDAFTNILNRMDQFMPEIKAANVEVEYGASGLGYAGNPTGSDVAPLVTVRLKSLQFTPITSFLFVTVPLPDFSAALTLEDGLGSVSN